MNTPTIHSAGVDQSVLYAIVARFLAAKIVAESNLEFWPVRDAVALSKSSSTASQATTQQQVGGEGGGAGSSTNVSGAGTGSGAQNAIVAGAAGIANSNRGIIDISSSDPAVTEAALAAGAQSSLNADEAGAYDVGQAAGVASDALASNVATTNAALGSNEAVSETALNDVGAVAAGAEQIVGQTAASSIAAGVTDTTNSDAFGEAAIQAAANSEASSTTALESTAAEAEAGTSQAADNAQTLANNAIDGTSQPIDQAALPTASDETGTSLGTVATWVGIIAGLIAIFYYVRKGNA